MRAWILVIFQHLQFVNPHSKSPFKLSDSTIYELNQHSVNSTIQQKNQKNVMSDSVTKQHICGFNRGRRDTDLGTRRQAAFSSARKAARHSGFSKDFQSGRRLILSCKPQRQNFGWFQPKKENKKNQRLFSHRYILVYIIQLVSLRLSINEDQFWNHPHVGLRISAGVGFATTSALAVWRLLAMTSRPAVAARMGLAPNNSKIVEEDNKLHIQMLKHLENEHLGEFKGLRHEMNIYCII